MVGGGMTVQGTSPGGSAGSGPGHVDLVGRHLLAAASALDLLRGGDGDLASPLGEVAAWLGRMVAVGGDIVFHDEPMYNAARAAGLPEGAADGLPPATWDAYWARRDALSTGFTEHPLRDRARALARGMPEPPDLGFEFVAA